MQHIETVTVGSGGAASITFSSIPDTFTDLYLVASIRAVSGPIDIVNVRLNGATDGHNGRSLEAYDTSVYSQSNSNSSSFKYAFTQGSSHTANTFSSSSFYFPNYASSTQYKSMSGESSSENNASLTNQGIQAGLFTKNDPITTILIYGTVNFVEFSSASLYGILAGSDGIVAVS